MPYRFLNFLENTLVHVFNRGNNHMTLFLEPQDYNWFMQKAHKLGMQNLFWTPAWCLMPNHFHFYLKLKSEDILSEFFQRLQLAYAKYFNRKYQRSGHVFEGPFKSVFVDREDYAIYLCRYIHLNPVKAQLVERPEDWHFSNYAELLKQNPEEFRNGFYESYFQSPAEYADFVNGDIGDREKNIERWLFD